MTMEKQLLEAIRNRTTVTRMASGHVAAPTCAATIVATAAVAANVAAPTCSSDIRTRTITKR
jgi:hypothetical protein